MIISRNQLFGSNQYAKIHTIQNNKVSCNTLRLSLNFGTEKYFSGTSNPLEVFLFSKFEDYTKGDACHPIAMIFCFKMHHSISQGVDCFIPKKNITIKYTVSETTIASH